MLTTAAIGVDNNATGADSATFKTTDAKLYVLIVTLSIEDNAKLSKLLSEGFRRSVYWNKYKVTDNIVVSLNAAKEEKYVRERLDASYEGVKRLFVLAYDNRGGDDQVSVDSFKKHFLPRVKIDYTTGCLLDFAYFEKSYRLIAADLSKQKSLDADSKAIQQIIFTGKIKSTAENTRGITFYILEQSKETMLEFSKRTTKVL